MATVESLTVDIIPVTKKAVKENIGTMQPIGKENVTKCIKNIGQYIFDHADKIAEDISHTIEIDIIAKISPDALPTIEIEHIKQIIDTSMATTPTREK